MSLSLASTNVAGVSRRIRPHGATPYGDAANVTLMMTMDWMLFVTALPRTTMDFPGPDDELVENTGYETFAVDWVTLRGNQTARQQVHPSRGRKTVSGAPRITVIVARRFGGGQDDTTNEKVFLQAVSQAMVVFLSLKELGKIMMATGDVQGRRVGSCPGMRRPAVNSSSCSYRRRGGRMEAA